MNAMIFDAAIYCIHFYITFYIKMNVTNILVNRAASVVLSPLSKEEAGLRQRIHRADTDR